jgi:hypothetical protein
LKSTTILFWQRGNEVYLPKFFTGFGKLRLLKMYKCATPVKLNKAAAAGRKK